jgi:hypothetical protein
LKESCQWCGQVVRKAYNDLWCSPKCYTEFGAQSSGDREGQLYAANARATREYDEAVAARDSHNEAVARAGAQRSGFFSRVLWFLIGCVMSAIFAMAASLAVMVISLVALAVGGAPDWLSTVPTVVGVVGVVISLIFAIRAD